MIPVEKPPPLYGSRDRETYRGAHRWITESQVMREHPRQWYLVTKRPNAQSAANFIAANRDGRRAAFRQPREFEWALRGSDVYGRHLGEERP
jgi:hypothetical protein